MMTITEQVKAAIDLVDRWGDDPSFTDVTAALPDADPNDWDNVYALTRRVRRKGETEGRGN